MILEILWNRPTMSIDNEAIVIDVNILYCLDIKNRSILAIVILGACLLLAVCLSASLGHLTLIGLRLLSSVLWMVLVKYLSVSGLVLA